MANRWWALLHLLLLCWRAGCVRVAGWLDEGCERSVWPTRASSAWCDQRAFARRLTSHSLRDFIIIIINCLFINKSYLLAYREAKKNARETARKFSGTVYSRVLLVVLAPVVVRFSRAVCLSSTRSTLLSRSADTRDRENFCSLKRPKSRWMSRALLRPSRPSVIVIIVA